MEYDWSNLEAGWVLMEPEDREPYITDATGCRYQFLTGAVLNSSHPQQSLAFHHRAHDQVKRCEAWRVEVFRAAKEADLKLREYGPSLAVGEDDRLGIIFSHRRTCSLLISEKHMGDSIPAVDLIKIHAIEKILTSIGWRLA